MAVHVGDKEAMDSPAGTFEFLEATMRRDASGTSFGKDFEWICKWYLETAPQYRGKFSRVFLWNEWPDRWGPDCGIDLVAETRSGELWAIQAKACSPDHTLSKREIDSFLSESNRPQIRYRLLIASTDSVGKNARRTIEQQEKRASLLLRGDLLASSLRWPQRIGGKAPKPAIAKPRPHQRAAIKAVVKGFKSKSRGQLIMACGTGKTLTGLWIKEALKSKRTLLLVPSISLVQQNLHEWGQYSKDDFDCLVVCSDETVKADRSDSAVQRVSELGLDVTTDPKQIAEFLRKRRKRPAVVIATYHSSERVSRGQQRANRWFDLTLCDEAHRLTGDLKSTFATVLNGKKIRSRKRLFMTATPRYFTERARQRAGEGDLELASMDDEKVFGPEFHVLSFREAIEAKPKPLLTEYQVAIIGVTSKDVQKWVHDARSIRTKDGTTSDAKKLAAQIGLVKAIDKYGLRRLITFHRTVNRAKGFVDSENKESLPSVIAQLSRKTKASKKIWARHISGATPASTRKSLLKALGSQPDGATALLSNCACLNEGVDVPSLDGIAFIDPRSSMIDIIQAVGRVIRISHDKQIGTIVVPVFIDESEDAENVLERSSFKHIWQVIRALRAHDTRLAEELDRIRLSLGSESSNCLGRDIELPANIHADLTVSIKDFAREFFVRTVRMTSKMPNLTIEQILMWADEYLQQHGRWPTQKSETVAGQWVTWGGINDSLRYGYSGLNGGTSLPKVLTIYRGYKSPAHQDALTVKEVLEWADSHRLHSGNWPNQKSGLIPGTSITWRSIDSSFRNGHRGLPVKRSLSEFLAEYRGHVSHLTRPLLSVDNILKWADAFRRSEGRWPNARDGQIAGESITWANINNNLVQGHRGLPGRMTLAKLLSEHRQYVSRATKPSLTTKAILIWASSYRQKHGQWPNQRSPELIEGEESWRNIDSALKMGYRGLPGGSSLSKLIRKGC